MGIELELEPLLNDIRAAVKESTTKNYPAINLRFEKDGATVSVYSSGKYNIHGASSIDELYSTNDKFLKRIESIVERDITPSELEVRNIVCVDEYEGYIDFYAFLEHMGEDNIEYEPEQFPALDYDPPDKPGVFKLFSTGKITLTGVNSTDSIEESFQEVKRIIAESQENVSEDNLPR